MWALYIAGDSADDGMREAVCLRKNGRKQTKGARNVGLRSRYRG